MLSEDPCESGSVSVQGLRIAPLVFLESHIDNVVTEKEIGSYNGRDGRPAIPEPGGHVTCVIKQTTEVDFVMGI